MSARPAKKQKVSFKDDNTKAPKETKVSSHSKRKAKGKEKASVPAPDSVNSFKIMAGSYEKLLYGLEYYATTPASSSVSDEGELKPIFIFPAHVACLKAVAASPEGGKWLVTGSTDEIIKVWDLRRKKEVGGLVQHSGSITHLSFSSKSYMISASEDGTITIFRVKDWVPVRTLKGHKGRVNSVAVHPGMRVALSVGKDKMLRMWDLKKGRSGASMKLGKEGEIIRWSTTYKHFAILSGSSIEVYTTEMKPITILSHKTRLHDFRFLSLEGGTREIILVAAEDKKVTVYEFEPDTVGGSNNVIAEFVGHQNRVKALDIIQLSSSGSQTDGESIPRTLLGTVSSDGFIHVYDIPPTFNRGDGEAIKIEPRIRYDTKGTRLTCVAFAENHSAATGGQSGVKRKLDEDEDDGETQLQELSSEISEDEGEDQSS